MSDANQMPYDKYVEHMKVRTKSFALRVIKLVQAMPRDFAPRVIGGQLLRAGTSVGANYRAACRARTDREFTNKIRIVMEESDESQYWLELVRDAGLIKTTKIKDLLDEATQLTAIFTSAHAKANERSTRRKRTAL